MRALLFSALLAGCCAFTPAGLGARGRRSQALRSCGAAGADPRTLPGDPSLILTTNVNLGDRKAEVMRAASELISEVTGKPMAYVACAVNDNASVMWAGEDTPCALGVLYSIGAINRENNGRITDGLTDLLLPFGVEPNRIYVNFFDVPRSNVGWNRATFGG